MTTALFQWVFYTDFKLWDWCFHDQKLKEVLFQTGMKSAGVLLVLSVTLAVAQKQKPGLDHGDEGKSII